MPHYYNSSKKLEKALDKHFNFDIQKNHTYKDPTA